LNLIASRPTYYGNGFTVRRREYDPCFVTHSRYAFWPRQGRKENVCIKAYCYGDAPSLVTVSKGNTLMFTLPVCFNTLPFFVLQEELHPIGRPFAPCFTCRAESSLLCIHTLRSTAFYQ
jgi:hypothetical protein